uniref:CAP-Gly domain-containing protein n=1 Tax=Megaselia scalaris TaxID=36166 RepID=T1GT24_MEGSC
MENIQIITGDFVKVNVTNSKNDSVAFEKKFPKKFTILELKEKLEIVTGGSAGTMQIELYNGDKLLGRLDNNTRLLGSYPIEDGMRLHVIDSFLFSEDFVEKFELTEEQYNQRQDTLKSFLKKNNLGKYNEEEMKELEEKRKKAAEEEQKKAALCTLGSRCQVQVRPSKRGEIMYNGELEGKKGIFIGIKYDEPLGKNDGSVDGVRYFECQPKYGGFVPPSAVEVGDFPPLDDLDDEL